MAARPRPRPGVLAAAPGGTPPHPLRPQRIPVRRRQLRRPQTAAVVRGGHRPGRGRAPRLPAGDGGAQRRSIAVSPACTAGRPVNDTIDEALTELRVLARVDITTGEPLPPDPGDDLVLGR